MTFTDSTKLTNYYALDGQVRQTSGSRSYAVGYSFDGQGRKTTMTNWTSFPSSGVEVTTWNYDQYRGWLTSKLDNSSHGPTYTYTSAGRLASRVWARGTNTSYAYTAAGEQATVMYNDSVTPGVTNTYDRLGRLSTAFHGVTTTTLSYDSANDPLSETNSGGTASTLSITNGYDAYLRRTNNVVFGGGSVLAKTTNSYDAASRVAVVSDGTNTGTYSYLANSALVDHLTLAHSGTNMMTNQNTYDYVNRLTGKTSALVFDYQYNTAGQRTKLTLIDGSYWLFTYDTLGQVTGGKKYFWDGTPVAGEQNTYTFDTIGNRTQAQAGGDQTGANLRTAGYTNNALNQITSRGVPGDVDVFGLSLATNTVSVNGTNAYQKWEYFREQMATNNTSAAQYVGINVTAAGQTTVSGNVFLAETPESYTYDLDGNLTQDGRWTYIWDGENRLVNQTSLSGAPTASKYELAFMYDYQGRRIKKLVSTYVSSAYVPQYTNLFEYDGWNLAAIVTSNNLLAASFVWGTDLSGSMQGAGLPRQSAATAGGVGGLLVENIVGNGVHFPAYDGNGNVVALVSVTNGMVTANYEYGPFGELLRTTGPAAKFNPFLFSTKYCDSESGFYYYGYRYYNPSTGRWLSRDPIAEQGGANLYLFCENAGINGIDPDGLECESFWDRLLDEAVGVSEITAGMALMEVPGAQYLAGTLIFYGAVNAVTGLMGENPVLTIWHTVASETHVDPRTGDVVYHTGELAADIATFNICEIGESLNIAFTGEKEVTQQVKTYRKYADGKRLVWKTIQTTKDISAEVRITLGAKIILDSYGNYNDFTETTSPIFGGNDGQ